MLLCLIPFAIKFASFSSSFVFVTWMIGASGEVDWRSVSMKFLLFLMIVVAASMVDCGFL